jgi:polygalacturonase
LPAADGIDPDGVQDGVIEDSFVSVGDDAIAVKSGFDWFGYTFGRPASNITFRRMAIGTGHGVSVGSEMSAGVYNVLFQDFVLNGTELGPRVKSQRQRGGLVANVTFSNFTLIGTGGGVAVTLHYLTNPPPGNATSTPRLQNITMDRIVAVPGTGVGTGTLFYGLPESVIDGVTLRDCDLSGAKVPIGPDCNWTVGACEGTVLPACPPCLSTMPPGQRRGR